MRIPDTFDGLPGRGERWWLAAVLAVHCAVLALLILRAEPAFVPPRPPAILGTLVQAPAPAVVPPKPGTPSRPRSEPPAPRRRVGVAARAALAPAVAPVARDVALAAPPATPVLAAADTAVSPTTIQTTTQTVQAPAPVTSQALAPESAASAKPAPVAPGAAVTPPRTDATHLDNPAPTYPAISRRLGEQGRVLLDVYILEDGRVGEIRVKRSSGYARLDDAALDAVRRWHYVPARRGAEAIPWWYVQPVSFALNG